MTEIEALYLEAERRFARHMLDSDGWVRNTAPIDGDETQVIAHWLRPEIGLLARETVHDGEILRLTGDGYGMARKVGA